MAPGGNPVCPVRQPVRFQCGRAKWYARSGHDLCLRHLHHHAGRRHRLDRRADGLGSGIAVSAAGPRLAAVLHVDLVGYGALKEWNAKKAENWVEALKNILGAEVPSGGGRLVTFAGEGSVADFPSAGAALSSAERILQRVAARNGGQQPEDRFELSLGLDLGEVVDEGAEIEPQRQLK